MCEDDDEANTKLARRRTINRRKCDRNADSTDKNNFSATTEHQWLKISERRGNGPLLRANSLKLLEHSTLCVFQWHKSRYRCYCCKEPFFNMDVLREHTFNVHVLKDIEKIIIMQQNLLVKVEISKLFCKICQNRVEDLTALRQHLTESHQVAFISNEDLLVPFKIGGNELQCQICFERFTAFRLLNVHMNKHYQKQVCSICGAGFSNLKFLNLHKVRQHRPLECKPCGLTFQNKVDKKHHDANVHGVKIERKLRFPCPYCNLRFLEESNRVRHLVDEHGLEKPEHKCLLCAKVFITKSLFNSHMKSIHMKEKNQECDVCHKFFYSKSDVSRHKVTHTGEKNYSCNLCNILYATKDSLRRHRKRAHVGQ